MMLQMLFYDLAEGKLAPYSLRLYAPSKYAVMPPFLKYSVDALHIDL